MDAEPAAFDDPTLGALDDAVRVDPVFPDTVDDIHFVLYQAMDGGLQLRWHLDASSLAHARDAFGKGLDAPTPVLRVHRLDGDGASRILVDASLDEHDLALDGLANCAADAANGLLQAEIGLSSAAGGWMLVARSNRMLATTPVGASFLRQREPPLPGPPLREPPLPEAPFIAQADTVVDTLAASQGQPLLSGPYPLALPQAELTPARFPLVEPEPGAGTDAMPLIAGLKRDSSPVHGDSASATQDGQITEQTEEQREGQREERREGQREEQTEAQGAGPRPMGVAPGSGPMHAFRADVDGEIGAELLVHGSAVPGTLLDLGGHPYRVGAGGRFSFSVPLTDQALIMGLLAMLSELPVECRPGDD